MRWPAELAARLRPSPGNPESPLRSEHPLVLATATLERVIRQWLVVAAVLAGALIADVDRQRWAPPLTLAAGVVLVILTVTALGLRQRKHSRAIDLILEGRETLSVAAVQRERRRLLSERFRISLARSFADVIEQAVRPQVPMRGAQPLFHPRIVRQALDDLRELARLVRKPQTSARGVAGAERLIGRGESPLYGDDVAALRAEIQRVNRLLSQ